MDIRDFEPRDAAAFKALNEAWITRHFALEPSDERVLGDPEGEVIAKGGVVLIGVEGEEPVACVALVALEDGGFEIAKMAVAESRRGTGLGAALMTACIARARALGAPRLYLESNLALKPAIGLYERFGFRHLPPEERLPSPYSRVGAWMELKL